MTRRGRNGKTRRRENERTGLGSGREEQGNDGLQGAGQSSEQEARAFGAPKMQDDRERG